MTLDEGEPGAGTFILAEHSQTADRRLPSSRKQEAAIVPALAALVRSASGFAPALRESSRSVPAAPPRGGSIPSGSLSLDYATGVGGFPRGRITELFGEEGAGKTALALHAAAVVQRAGGVAAVIDLEGAVTAAVARLAGADPDRLLLSRPSCGEEALEIGQMLLRSNEVDLLAIDSAAALSPRGETAGRLENPLPADWLGAPMRRMAALLPQSRTCVLFTNQIRRNLHRPGGAAEVTPGGSALRLLAALRIELHKAGAYSGHPGGPAAGLRVRARVVKNKLAAPYALAGFWLDFAHGLDRAAELLAFGRRAGLIRGCDGAVLFEGTALGPDRAAARDRLRRDGALRQRLEERILAAWNGQA